MPVDPASVRPMLATTAVAPLKSSEYVYEPKYDGIRAIAIVEPGPLRGTRPTSAGSQSVGRVPRSGPAGGSMPAYWVARSKITDPVAYKKYTDRIPDIMKQYGGKVLARGGKYQIMEGPDTFHRFVVIEFPTLEQGVACFESPEYQAAAAFRRAGGGIVANVMVDGGDATT
jgi:uncharacterized protein (DUF1330 family)